jgi:hypothetical protein
MKLIDVVIILSIFFGGVVLGAFLDVVLSRYVRRTPKEGAGKARENGRREGTP